MTTDTATRWWRTRVFRLSAIVALIAMVAATARSRILGGNHSLAQALERRRTVGLPCDFLALRLKYGPAAPDAESLVRADAVIRAADAAQDQVSRQLTHEVAMYLDHSTELRRGDALGDELAAALSPAQPALDALISESRVPEPWPIAVPASAEEADHRLVGRDRFMSALELLHLRARIGEVDERLESVAALLRIARRTRRGDLFQESFSASVRAHRCLDRILREPDGRLDRSLAELSELLADEMLSDSSRLLSVEVVARIRQLGSVQTYVRTDRRARTENVRLQLDLLAELSRKRKSIANAGIVMAALEPIELGRVPPSAVLGHLREIAGSNRTHRTENGLCEQAFCESCLLEFCSLLAKLDTISRLARLAVASREARGRTGDWPASLDALRSAVGDQGVIDPRDGLNFDFGPTPDGGLRIAVRDSKAGGADEPAWFEPREWILR